MESETIHYYESLYNAAPDAWVVVSVHKHKPEGGLDRGEHRAHRAIDLPKALAAPQPPNTAKFATFAAFKAPPASGRGKAEDIGMVFGAYLDIDVGDAGKYAGVKNPAAELDQIKATILEWGLPVWSAIVKSGNGYHFEWRLDRPIEIHSAADRAQAEAFTKGFNSFAIGKAAEIGWALDSMGDLARVKRAVGSTNWKNPADPKPVTLVELNPIAVYSLAELSAFAPPEEAARPPRSHASRSAANTSKAPDWQLIAANCPFAGYCVENASTLPYPYWFAILGVAARCDNGGFWAHEISRGHPGYNAKETDAKIAETLKADGPVTYAHIRNDLGFRGCDNHVLANRAHSPIQFGFSSQALIDLMTNHAYDLSSERFFDLTSLAPISGKAFNMAHAHRLDSPVTAFSKSPLAIKVAKVDYLPGQGRLIAVDGQTILNTYRAPSLVPSAGSCATILAHFDYLVPDPASRQYLLDYYAHMVQQPGEKISTALLVYGPQGTGKSMAVDLLCEIVGTPNTVMVPAEALAGRFKADRVNRQLMILNEVMGVDRAVANSLKQWISDPFIRVEEKGTPTFEGRTPKGHILLTNHANALALERGDRRYAVIETATERREPEYYRALAAAIPSELPAFAQFLKERDLSAFNPHASAPESKAKAQMQSLSLTPLEATIEDAIASKRSFFQRDVGTVDDVIAFLMANGWTYRRPTPQSVGAVLGALGAVNLGQQRVGTGRARLWAWDNQAKWLAAAPDAVAAHYMGVASNDEATTLAA